MSDDFTLLENRLRQPFLAMVKKYGKQKYTLWAVWTYMLWRSTNGVFCLPEELVREDLGMDVYTLRRARAILVEEEWLRKDILRDTGGTYLTRTWVLTSPPMLNATVVDPPMHLTTVVKSPHSGSSSVSGYGSPSVSASRAVSSSDSDSGNCVSASKTCTESKDGGKPKPTNPEPTPAVPMAEVNGKGNGEGARGMVGQAKPKACCKECGLELKRDENHLLTCPVLNKKPAWHARAYGEEETMVARRLDNWDEL